MEFEIRLDAKMSESDTWPVHSSASSAKHRMKLLGQADAHAYLGHTCW